MASALNARFGLGNLQHHKGGRLHTEHLALVGQDTANVVLLYELEVIGQIGTVHRHHIKSLLVHKIIQAVVVVGIHHFLALNVSGGELGGGVVALLHHGTGNHILYLCTNKSGAFTGLYMLELHNLKHIAVLFKGYAVSEITC